MKSYQNAHFAGKANLYKTARATIGCALFKTGDFVSVKYQRTELDGTIWFQVSNNNGTTYYPAHHLTNFVL